MTRRICPTHSVTDCGTPAMVMARSVELSGISPATGPGLTLSRISLIAPHPAFPNQGAALGGRHHQPQGDRGPAGAVLLVMELLISSSSLSMIIAKALKMALVGPVE